MDCFDYVIVGSGPAGVAAARRLEGRGVCMVDAGEQPSQNFPYTTLRAALLAGDTKSLLGENWEMLGNLVEPNRMHPKLRAPALRFVMSGERFNVRDAKGETILCGAGSHAAGGMSNAWGAQLMRYTDADLAEAGDWPFEAAALERYYVDLEEHIGISGQEDEMHEFLGAASRLLPPIPAVPAAACLYSRYLAHKSGIGLCLGRPRLALATKPFRNRTEFGYGETEFFTSGQLGLYTARNSLDELLAGGRISYLARHKLLAYRESPEHVELDLIDMDSGMGRTVRARHLLLGCGTMQTARLVLLNRSEPGRALPFMDHPPTLLPLFLPNMFGSALPDRSFPVQMVGTLVGLGRRDMISFYYPGGLLRSDLLPDIPLPMDVALKLLGNLLGGMLVAQIWETSRPSPKNRLRLDAGGEIEIDYPDRKIYSGLGPLLAALRSYGAYSLKHLATMSPPGWGFHHVGCLPMRKQPSQYETHVDGRLWDSKRVRLIDGSVLPSLPAKNHSLTLMANAARISEEAIRCGY
jgi:choline dehydrogenase-like flavoprotein